MNVFSGVASMVHEECAYQALEATQIGLLGGVLARRREGRATICGSEDSLAVANRTSSPSGHYGAGGECAHSENDGREHARGVLGGQ